MNIQRPAAAALLQALSFVALVVLLICEAGSLDVSAATLRGADMDYGPFLCYSVQTSNEVTCKGVTVKLSARTNTASVLFDTDTLRYSAAWTGDWLNLAKTHLTTEKGELPPRVAGHLEFTNRVGPGWASGGSFDDPRPNETGPLPKPWAHYKALVRVGSNVVFRYTVGGCEVIDMPGLIDSKGFPFFTRTLRISPNATPMIVRLRDAGCDTLPPGVPCPAVVLLEGKGVQVRLNGDRIEAAVAAHETPITAVFLFVDSVHGQAVPFDQLDRVHVPPLPDLDKGGPPLWPTVITTQGRRGVLPGPFAVDTLTLPEKNPWQSWLRLTGLDFFTDGRAVVTTWSGDAWIVAGIDDTLRGLKWKRFAAGLFDPLGVKVVDDQVFVLERSQITRLRDVNGDGEADVYENFNNDTSVSPSYHAFAMDLQTDRAGNFYFARAGQRVEPIYALNGGLVRVSSDGSHSEMIAHGLRVANGVAIGPNDEIVCSDNQGNWMPACRLNVVQPGSRFYGYVPHAHGIETNVVPPLCWIPMSMDNSSGGGAFVSGDKWPAALKGHLLHTSYGTASLFEVLSETVGGVAQGGTVRLPLKFDSGIMRARFNLRDGQLYVAGLRGWQTKVARDGALQRVRYTGAPLRMPTELHVRSNGLEIAFSEPLDRPSAEDVQNWNVEQWNYRWTEKYGSDDYSVREPEKKGHDTVEIEHVTLLPDNRRVLVQLADLRPVMQVKIKFAVQSAEGAKVAWEIYNTINVVPR